MEEQQNNAPQRRTPARGRTTNAPMLNELGRVPPQAIEMEQAVLGAMLLEKNAVTDTIDMLSEDAFYDPKHQYIYGAVRALFGSSNPIDLLTVTQELRSQGLLEAAGGAVYISSLTQRVASAANVEFHARVIAQKYIQRELIRVCSESLKDAYDETMDVFDLLSKAEGSLFGIAEKNMKKSVMNMNMAVHQALLEIEVATKQGDGLSGIPTGFNRLDQLTSGWQRSDMIVIAARPAMGKTAFVLSMARNTAVDYNMGVAVFSLEMSAVQLVKRLIASEARVSAEKLRKGDLSPKEFSDLGARVEKLSRAPIYIDDTPGLSVFDLRAKCRRLSAQHNIQMVIIDYLQLMSAGGSKGSGNREQEISTISRSIKEIAKELNIPIIALSQLSRSVETRGGDKRPVLSDLRESGAIEQDADIVGFLYRPEYYGITEDANGNPTQGVGEVIIAKHRNGALDNVQLRFVGQFARFENLEDQDFNGFEPQGGDFSVTQLRSGMTPNSGFETPNVLIRKSKMNDDTDDEQFNSFQNGDVPF